MTGNDELPVGWAWAKVSELSHYVTSGARNWSKYYSESGVLFVRTEDINKNCLDLTKTARMKLPEGTCPVRTRIEKGDILVTVTGANVGKCAYVQHEMEEAYPSQSVALVKLKNQDLAPYIHKCMIAPGYGQAQLSGMVYGLGRPVLNLDNIRDVRLPIAPQNEQRRIVQKIEELFSKLDAGVAALERVKANLKRYRATVLKAAVEGKLTAEWRTKHPDTEPASKLLERILNERRRKWEEVQLAKYAAAGKEPPKGWREKYKEPAGPDTTVLPELPAGWCWVTIIQVANTSLGKMLDKTKHRTGRRMPYLRNVNVRWGHVDTSDLLEMYFDDDELERFGLRQGDVLICEGGEPGRAAVWNGTMPEMKFQKALHRVRCWACLEPSILVYTMEYLARSGRLERNFTGSTIKHFTGESFATLPLRLPAFAEQATIVAEVERRLSIVDELEGQVTADLKRAGRLRQSILKRAFAGRLVPQDPNDEPAAKLLERITATQAISESHRMGNTLTRTSRPRAKLKMQDGRSE